MIRQYFDKLMSKAITKYLSKKLGHTLSIKAESCKIDMDDDGYLHFTGVVDVKTKTSAYTIFDDLRDFYFDRPIRE